MLICLKCICLLVFRSTKDAGSFNLKIPRGILIPQMFFLISKFSYLLLKGWFTSSRKKKKKRLLSKRKLFSLEEKPKALALPKEVDFGISEPDLGFMV